jgi:hypothetical protein
MKDKSFALWGVTLIYDCNQDAERIAGSTGFTITDPWANFTF